MTDPSSLDTHLHLIDRSVLAYPWLASEPALNQDFTLERYQVEAFRCGVGSALHMEVDVAASYAVVEAGSRTRSRRRPISTQWSPGRASQANSSRRWRRNRAC
jgi:predicted TIM-barrel fold metal-dependent hydrolase